MKYNDKNHAYKMTTKAEKRFMYSYWQSYFYHPLGSIDDAYKDPSYFKVQAWEYEISRAKLKYLHIMNPQVITRNTFQFSMGYEFTDAETGELCFMYITSSYRRYCTLSDLEEVSKQSFE